MKTNKTKNIFLLASLLVMCVFVVSCGTEDPDPEPEPDPVIADFTWALQAESDSVVVFTNKSVNATSYSWDFGDGSAVSTDANPTHAFRTGTVFTVTLTATGEGGTDDVSKALDQFTNSVDPNSPIQILTAGTTKVWKLAPEENALNFGPIDNENTVWWGNPAAAVDSRSCMFDNTFTFNFDGTYSRDINGALWKEWKVFDEVSGEGCLAEGDEAVTRKGTNVDAWKDGSFTFALSVGDSTDIITVSGMGGFIGHYTCGTATSDYAAHDTYTYSIEKIEQNKIWLQGFGWGGDSDGLEGYDATKPDRLVRVVLVPAE